MTKFSDLLPEYPDITKRALCITIPMHNTKHHNASCMTTTTR